MHSMDFKKGSLTNNTTGLLSVAIGCQRDVLSATSCGANVMGIPDKAIWRAASPTKCWSAEQYKKYGFINKFEQQIRISQRHSSSLCGYSSIIKPSSRSPNSIQLPYFQH